MSEKVSVENTTPKGVTVSADKLMSVVLERSISDKDQTIGAHKQTIEYLKKQNQELSDELAAEKARPAPVADDQKVMVIKAGNNGKSRVCPHCGYNRNTTNNYCYECDTNIKSVPFTEENVEYRNLDDVIKQIQETEAKKLKVNNIELEEKLNTAEFELKKIKNELSKVESTKLQDLTDAKRDVRDRYQKEIADQRRRFEEIISENESKIDELVEEIQKLEENKTDAEVEEARKQEIIDLKTQISELESVIEEAKSTATGRMKKFWQKIADRSAQRKLEEEKEAKQQRIEEISNKYPKTTSNETPWWKRGKYATKNESNPLSDWLHIW